MDIVFKALNDKTRREILELLKEKKLTAGEISDQFSMSKPTISHHLDLLRQANLVVSIKKGQHIFYSINSTELDELLKWILKVKDKVKGKKK